MVLQRKKLPYKETEEQWEARQNKALVTFVTGRLYVQKDEKLIRVILIDEMETLLCDLFYGRVNKVILWANRGGGKSLLAAILIWLSLVYHKRSFMNMGSAGNQAKRVYDYTVQFWANVPGLQGGMLAQDPLMEKTLLKNGTRLICATSQSSAIGEHMPGFIADEACTDRVGGDNALLRTMQGCLTEDDPLIFLLSTFHLPVGFFADMWDDAEKHGFTQYKWNCFDTMKQCTAGLEEATEEDPQALSFCMNKCPLTWVEPERDERGEVVGYAPAGCRGRARTARGWIDREKVLEAQRVNIGTRIFAVEHSCQRPRHDGTIFDPAVIDRCVVQSFPLILDRPLTVGIDWGLTEAAMTLIGEWRDVDPQDAEGFIEGIGVLAVRYLHGEGVGQVAAQIKEWLEVFGDPERQREARDAIKCRADANSPYPNRELRVNYRYRVKGVKGDRKNIGKDNVSRWLASGHFRILGGNTTFVDQMKNLRRDMGTGKQIKDNKKGEEGDHGPDACRFALMDYDFIRWLKKQGMLEVDRKEETPPPRNPRRRDTPSARPRKDNRSGRWRGRSLDAMIGF